MFCVPRATALASATRLAGNSPVDSAWPQVERK